MWERNNCVIRQKKCMELVQPKKGNTSAKQIYFLSGHGKSSSTGMFTVPDNMIFVMTTMEGTAKQVNADAVLAAMPNVLWQNLLAHNDNVAVSNYLNKHLPSHQANVSVYRPGDQFLDIMCYFDGEINDSEYFATGLMSLKRAEHCISKTLYHTTKTKRRPIEASMKPSKCEAESNKVISAYQLKLFNALDDTASGSSPLSELYESNLLPPGVCIVSTCRGCTELERASTGEANQLRVRFDDSVGEVADNAFSPELKPGTATVKQKEDFIKTLPVRGRGAFKGKDAVSCDPKKNPEIGVAGITPDVWCEMKTGYARCLRKKTCARQPKGKKLRAVHNAQPDSPMVTEWDIQQHVDATLNFNVDPLRAFKAFHSSQLSQEEQNKILEGLATKIMDTDVDSYRIDKSTNLMKYKMRYFQKLLRDSFISYRYNNLETSFENDFPNLVRLMDETVPPTDLD